MKCFNCGAEISEDSKFCRECGTQVALESLTSVNSGEQVYANSTTATLASTDGRLSSSINEAVANAVAAAHTRANIATKEYYNSKREVNEIAYLYSEELKTFNTMNKAARVLLLFSVVFFVGLIVYMIAGVADGTIQPVETSVNSESSTKISPLVAVVLTLLTLATLFFSLYLTLLLMVWGFFALRSFFRSHDFFFVGNSVMMLMAFLLFIYVAVFAAIPFYFRTKKRVKEYKAMLDSASEDLAAKERNLRAMGAL